MINPTSRSLEWIKEASFHLGVHDIALVEKTIRAFSLLEALARSGCPFIFKGGSSLMLHLSSSKRLSIDIDIICPPGALIEDYLDMYADEYRLLQDGIRRIGNFIVGDKYTLDSAIVDASKVAYLCKLIEKGIDEIRHYSPEMLGDLTGQVLQQPMPTKLNKLKKTHPEAFFYFNEIQLMQ